MLGFACRPLIGHAHFLQKQARIAIFHFECMSFKMEHLSMVCIRTKPICGGSGFDDGTIKLTQWELLKLRHSLGMRMDGIRDKLEELKDEGEIKGHGNNFKVTKRDGVTQPEPLEITGEKRPRASVKRNQGC